MPICLFCDSELDGNAKAEHILLNALGGRKTAERADCPACNNRFGGTIDAALASQVMVLRNLLQLESGTGNPAPTLKNVQAGAYKINIKGDGDLELVAKPFVVTELGGGRWNVQVEVGSEEKFQRIVPHIAAKTKIPEDRLREQLAAAAVSKMSQRPGIIGHALSFGGPEATRSMVKSSLVLWSTLVGNAEVRGIPYDDARRFVVDRDERFNFDRTQLDSRFLPDGERMAAGFGPIFNLIYVRSDGAGRVVGHFALYNLISWHFVLAASGGTPNKKIALISNPLDPAKWSDRAAEEFDIPFDWLNSPDYSDETTRLRAGFDSVMKHYISSNRTKVNLRIIDECFKSLDLEEGNPVPSDKIQILFKLISHRIVNHHFGLPYVEPIAPGHVAQLLAVPNVRGRDKSN